MAKGQFSDPLRLLDRARADDHLRRTCVEQVGNQLAGSNAAAHLHRQSCAGKQRAYDLDVGTAPRGGIEIHDVQTREAVVLPGARDLHRIIEPHALLGILAADELHARTVAEIHCGNGDHLVLSSRAAARKACRKRTPSAELFSG